MIRLKYFVCVALAMLGLNSFTSQLKIILPTEQKIIHDLCFSKHGTTLLVADGTNVRWFSTESYKMLGLSANGHSKQLLTIDLSADSSILVSGGKDSTIVLWNVKENKILKRLSFHKGIVTSLQLSSDNNYLISGGTDHKVFIYDLREQRLRYEISDHKDDVTSVKFSPNNNFFCTGGADGILNFYDANTGDLINSFDNLGFIREVDFSQDNSKLISCGDQSKVTIWLINQSKKIDPLETVKSNDGWLLTSKIGEDGRSISTGSLSGVVRIKTDVGTYISKLGVGISDIEFKPNNKSYLTLAIASLGKGAYILEARNMKLKN